MRVSPAPHLRVAVVPVLLLLGACGDGDDARLGPAAEAPGQTTTTAAAGATTTSTGSPPIGVPPSLGRLGSSTTTATRTVRSTTTTTVGPTSTAKLTTTTTTVTTTTAARSGFVGYEAILGSQFDDPVVLGYVGDNNCSPSGLHYVCSTAGTELSFTTGRRLVAVLLFGPAVGNRSTYAGTLPGGLTWTDSRAMVDAKVGPPGSDYPGYPPVMAWSLYQNPPILITWNTTGTVTPGTGMHHLEVKASS